MANETKDLETQGAEALQHLSTIAARQMAGNAFNPEQPSKTVFADSRPEAGPPAGFLRRSRTRSLGAEDAHMAQQHAEEHMEQDSEGGINQRFSTQSEEPVPATVKGEKDLRETKSAPNLDSPALAAIRGLQAGTLHLDRRMRSKIATAAKRVLQAREFKRRVSQERQFRLPAIASAEAEGHQLESPSKVQKLDTASPSASLVQQARIEPAPQTPPSSSHQPSMDMGGGSHLVPQSLATAAAIARGEPLSLTQPPAVAVPAPSQSISDSGGMTNFHRPALSNVQMGTVASSSYRPFTVTTGVPRFSQGPSRARSGPAIAPMTPMTSPMDSLAAPVSPSHAGSAAQLQLNLGDLSLPPSQQLE